MGFWRIGPVIAVTVAASIGLLQSQSGAPSSVITVLTAADNNGGLTPWCRLAPTGPSLTPETWWNCVADDDSAAIVYWDETESSWEVETGVDMSLGTAYASENSEAVLGIAHGSVGAVAASLGSTAYASGYDRSAIEVVAHGRSDVDALAAFLSSVRSRAYNGSTTHLRAFNGSTIGADASAGSTIEALAQLGSTILVNAAHNSSVAASSGLGSNVRADVRHDSTAALLAFENSTIDAAAGDSSSVDVTAGDNSSAVAVADSDSSASSVASNSSTTFVYAGDGSTAFAAAQDDSAASSTAYENSTSEVRAYNGSTVVSTVAYDSDASVWAWDDSQVDSITGMGSSASLLVDSGAHVQSISDHGSNVTGTFHRGEGLVYADANGTIWVYSDGEDARSQAIAHDGARLTALVESDSVLITDTKGNVDASVAATGSGSGLFLHAASNNRDANVPTPSAAGNATAASVLGLASNGGQVILYVDYNNNDTFAAKADGEGSRAILAVSNDARTGNMVVAVLALEGGKAQFEIDQITGEVTIGCFGGRTSVRSQFGSCDSIGSVTVLRTAAGVETVHHNLVKPEQFNIGLPIRPWEPDFTAPELFPDDWSPFDEDDAERASTPSSLTSLTSEEVPDLVDEVSDPADDAIPMAAPETPSLSDVADAESDTADSTEAGTDTAADRTSAAEAIDTGAESADDEVALHETSEAESAEVVEKDQSGSTIASEENEGAQDSDDGS